MLSFAGCTAAHSPVCNRKRGIAGLMSLPDPRMGRVTPRFSQSLEKRLKYKTSCLVNRSRHEAITQ